MGGRFEIELSSERLVVALDFAVAFGTVTAFVERALGFFAAHGITAQGCAAGSCGGGCRGFV